MLLGGLLLAFALPCLAENDSAEDITYMTEENRPLNFSVDGQPTGLAVELLRLIWQRMGVPPQPIHVVPWPRAYNTGQFERRTMVFSMFRTKSREHRFKWVGPITQSQIQVNAQRDRHVRADSPDALRSLDLGAVRDEVSTFLLKEAGIRYTEIPRPDSAVKMLTLGRIDALALGEHQFRQTVLALGMRMSDYETILVLGQGPVYYAFSRDTPDDLIRRFQKALDAVRLTPIYRNLLNFYLR